MQYEDDDTPTIIGALHVPVKVARALEHVRCKDTTRWGLTDIGVKVDADHIRLSTTNGHTLLRLTIPNIDTPVGSYQIAGGEAHVLAKTPPGVMPHGSQSLALSTEDSFPDADAVFPSGPRTAADAVGINPRYLREVADCYKDSTSTYAPKTKGSAVGFRRSGGSTVSPVTWEQGDRLSPVLVTWSFPLSAFESFGGADTRDCKAEMLLMPMRLD